MVKKENEVKLLEFIFESLKKSQVFNDYVNSYLVNQNNDLVYNTYSKFLNTLRTDKVIYNDKKIFINNSDNLKVLWERSEKDIKYIDFDDKNLILRTYKNTDRSMFDMMMNVKTGRHNYEHKLFYNTIPVYIGKGKNDLIELIIYNDISYLFDYDDYYLYGYKLVSPLITNENIYFSVY